MSGAELGSLRGKLSLLLLDLDLMDFRGLRKLRRGRAQMERGLSSDVVPLDAQGIGLRRGRA